VFDVCFYFDHLCPLHDFRLREVEDEGLYMSLGDVEESGPQLIISYCNIIFGLLTCMMMMMLMMIIMIMMMIIIITILFIILRLVGPLSGPDRKRFKLGTHEL